MVNLLLLLFVLTFATPGFCAEQPQAEQTVSEFNLAGFAEKGKKSWELNGKSADIFAQNVKLKDIVGKLYGEEEVTLTAEKGNFDKLKGNVQLEDNVVINTANGARLLTQRLNWDRNKQLVSTKESVNIQRDNIIADAIGATGEPNLKRVSLKEQVKVQINPDSKKKESKPKDKIVITCDGPLEVDYEKNIAVFYTNVKVAQKETQIYSDQMDVHFITADKESSPSETLDTAMGGKLRKIIAKGNVKIIRGENISYSDQAVYDMKDKKIILTGAPQLVIYSTGESDDASVRN